MNEALALIIAYLLGSIPSAYIASRWLTGRDIRQMGGGNIGSINTFREVGLWAGIIVGVVDFGKGAAAVAIAYGLLEVSPPFVLLAGLMSVVGHNWMVWLKFGGGKGLAAAAGALAVIMPLYGYVTEFLIFLGIIIVPLIITGNIALSASFGLLALPVITWLATKSGLATILAVALLLLIGLKYLPTARATLRRAGSASDLIFDRRQKERDRERRKKT